jgi:aerobic carbon-monoxide dehydrogenase small subunit
MTETTIHLTVNGESCVVEIPANLLLADLLRDRFGLRGTKVACDQGACGACTVLIDGLPVTSCLTFAFTVNEKSVVTIEGVSKADGALDRVQQAFHDSGVPQCGFCTPGMVLLTKALLDRADKPGAAEIDGWLAANICRCSGYQVFRRALGCAEEPAS